MYLFLIYAICVFLSRASALEWVGKFEILGVREHPIEMVVSGNYAFVRFVRFSDTGNGFYVLDISNANEPRLIGCYDSPHNIYGIEVSGNYVYLNGDSSTYLQIVDVSDAARPRLAGSYSHPGIACDIVVSGKYAFIVDNSRDLHVLDIGNPASPKLAGACEMSGPSWKNGFFWSHIFIWNNYAVVSYSYSNVDLSDSTYMIDISNPESPQFKTSLGRISGYGRKATVFGNNAYWISDDSLNLMIFDTLNPLFPRVVGQCSVPPGGWEDITVSGNYAYITKCLDKGYGILIFDISNYPSMQLINTFALPEPIRDIAISKNKVLILFGSGVGNGWGIHVLDVSNLTLPRLVALYDTLGGAYNVAISGNYAYISGQLSFFHVIDLKNPMAPQFVSSLNRKYSYSPIVVSEPYAFVMDNLQLKIIDISSVLSLTVVGSCDCKEKEDELIFFSSGLALYGDYIFITDELWNLKIVDISNPLLPRLAGTYSTPRGASSISISRNYAYVSVRSGGFQVLDISSPTTPRLVGSLSGINGNITLSGNYAYVAAGIDGLQIIDISDPASPRLVGSYNTPGHARDVLVFGNFAAVADGFSLIPVLDISDPANIRLVGTYYTKGNSRNMALYGEYLVSADGTDGLSIIDLKDIQLTVGLVPVDHAAMSLPSIFLTHANPFRPNSAIWFSLNGRQVGPASLGIYTLDGRLVRRLFSGPAVQGMNSVVWDGRDNQGRLMAAGTYVSRLSTGRNMAKASKLLLER